MATHAGTPIAAQKTWKRRFLQEAVRWLETVGQWALATPFLLMGLALVVFLPAALAVKLTEWTFSTGYLAVEIAAVTVLMILTSAGLWWAFAGRRLAERLRFGRFDPIMRMTTVAVFAVASFAGLTALLHVEGALGFKGEPSPEEILIDETSELYVWQLANTLPLLDIPGNLEWEKPIEFEDRIGGFLVVVFTGIVILPLIPALRLIAAGYRQPYEDAVLKALRGGLGRRNVHPTRGERGNDRAVVDRKGRIVVDVMQGVWTEDAPLRRLNVVPFFQATQAAEGYLLVADAVGERARDRIESAFAEQDYPARLAVWRSDQPAVHLVQVVEELEAQIATRPTQPAASPD
jgi:hypothetical protein